MVIAKFSRDSIDMSNAHCGDCLAGATESLYECARQLRRCTAAHPWTLPSGRDAHARPKVTVLVLSYTIMCPFMSSGVVPA